MNFQLNSVTKNKTCAVFTQVFEFDELQETVMVEATIDNKLLEGFYKYADYFIVYSYGDSVDDILGASSYKTYSHYGKVESEQDQKFGFMIEKGATQIMVKVFYAKEM